jgi:mRNA interferase RelE/StbE
MNVYFDSKFVKKLKKINNKTLAKQIEQAINDVSEAKSLNELPKAKKLSGHTDLFRYRIGDYRIGIQLISEKSVEFLDFDKRNDFYKSWP